MRFPLRAGTWKLRTAEPSRRHWRRSFVHCQARERSPEAPENALSYRYLSEFTTGTLPPDIARAISREELVDLPIGEYKGDICLVRTPRDLERAQEDLRQEQFVGFDTETRPSFKKGDVHSPCLIQAA